MAIAHNPIGIMQGRLLPPVGGRIQVFPEKGWEEEFWLAEELGLDCIEFIFEGEEHSGHPLMNERGIKKIKQLEAETGVKVLSVCADYFMDFPLHRGESEKAIPVLNNLIRNCSMLSVKDIIIPCVDRSRLTGPEEMGLFEVSLKKCLPLAEKYGINLTLETDLPPDDFLHLMRRLNSSSIKINYDIGNSASLGYDPEGEINSYGKYITDVHIKDRILGGGTVPLGEGNANFLLVFKKLKEVNFRGVFILQTARRDTGREKDTIKEYLAFIRQFLNSGHHGS